MTKNKNQLIKEFKSALEKKNLSKITELGQYMVEAKVITQKDYEKLISKI